MAAKISSRNEGQFSAAELKEKHEAQLQKREALAKQRVTCKSALFEALEKAAIAYSAHSTKKNYRKLSVASRRMLNAWGVTVK